MENFTKVTQGEVQIYVNILYMHTGVGWVGKEVLNLARNEVSL